MLRLGGTADDINPALPKRVYRFRVYMVWGLRDFNPALPITRNKPSFPEFRVLKVMQDLYHQQ